MDDDIRNRFRGVNRGSDYSRPARPIARPPAPAPRPAAPQPAPAPKPLWPPKPAATTAPTPSRSAKPSKPPKPPKAKKPRRQKRARKRRVIIFIIVVLLAAGAAGYYFYRKHNNANNQFDQQLHTPAQTSDATAKPTGTVRLVAIGDNWAFDSINGAAKQADGSYDYLPMMSNFKPFFDKSDVRVCTETTPGGGDKNGLAISAYPDFNAPTAWNTSFAALGCNAVNLATNHINDKGQPAIDATLASWDEQKNILGVAGANRSADEQNKIDYFTVKGLKFAFLAYTTQSKNAPASGFTVNQYSPALADAQITEARKNANIVLVAMTWGAENADTENAEQNTIAQHLADQNVDVVVGNGPQVLQPAKILSGKDGHQSLVWFSLGNFLSSELPVNNLIGGMAVMDFDVATQQIKDPKLMPTYMHYEWTAAQKASNNVNARHDFKLYPLDLAAEPLAKSQNGTNVAAQMVRATSIITKYAPIKVIKSTEF